MDPRQALTADDAAIRAHVATLDDEQLLAFIADVDTAEVVAKQTAISLPDSALYYARRVGWPVFPLVPRGKRPLTPRGFYDATTDLDTVAAWWERWPEANIGTPTGADGCGYDVIDVDGRVGIASLADLKHSDCAPGCNDLAYCGATGELPAVHARAFTPRPDDDGPGLHYYVAPTGDGNSTALAPGIDYRGTGGYVVVPPSVGANGVRYAWITRPELRP